jgi:hypothetical protein
MFEDFSGCWIVTSRDGKIFKFVFVLKGFGGCVVCISGYFTARD